MFNNCKHIRSKADYNRIVMLDSGSDMAFDGTRLIVGSSYDQLSTTNFANYISTVDSGYNVYKHVAGGVNGNYAHARVSILNGMIFSQSAYNTANGTVTSAFHNWNNSTYAWTSNRYSPVGTYGLGGILKSTNYIWEIANSGTSYVYSHDTSTTVLSTSTFSPIRISSAVSQGVCCYNDIRFYIQHSGTPYKPGYITISGNAVSGLTAITITEASGENWYGGAVANGKALYLTNSGKAAVIDCATNTYTYLGTVLPTVSQRQFFSSIDNYIYLDSYYGGYDFHRFNALDNTFTTFNKMTDSSIHTYCKGFNDDIYAIERDNTTKQHYLLKLDI
jgi:hypothetical protein